MSTNDKKENIKNDVQWSRLPTVNFRKLEHKTLGSILVESDIISQKDLTEALEKQKQAGDSVKLGEILVENEYVSETNMLKALAMQLDIAFYPRLPVNDIDPSLIDQIPIQFCRDNCLLPVARDAFNVTVAISDPLNISPLDDLRQIFGINIYVIVSPRSVIENSINRVFERASDASQKVIDELKVPTDAEDSDLESAVDLLDTSDDDGPIIRLVNGLLSRALKERATDIHIEPFEHQVIVRFRIDGALQDKMELPRRHAKSISTRLKIMGKLNIAESRIPQDGRIPIKIAGKDVDVRLSILPVAYGERAVMRLLDKSGGGKRLDQMGIEPSLYRQFCNLIEQNHGIFLVTGPTGSGKTTLLYACLMHVNTSDINILTIEDPVEYQLNGVGQIEVKEKVGMTFAAGLRAILRQDPDVVMIGEIRDGETARIAVQASITGHLVLSTIHTNDTASTVTRLVDLGIQPFQVSTAVLGIAATRLIRKLCTSCREEYAVTDGELTLMNKKRSDIENLKIYRAGNGCEVCLGLGYKDRVGIHELLIVDDSIRETLLRTTDAKEIKRVATAKGMKTLRDSAIEKVMEGITSLDEALRKTQSEDFDSEVEMAMDDVIS